jgi:hypothetical protein
MSVCSVMARAASVEISSEGNRSTGSGPRIPNIVRPAELAKLTRSRWSNTRTPSEVRSMMSSGRRGRLWEALVTGLDSLTGGGRVDLRFCMTLKDTRPISMPKTRPAARMIQSFIFRSFPERVYL